MHNDPPWCVRQTANSIRIPQFLAICKAFAGGFAESFPVGGLGDGVAGGLQHRTVVTLRAGAYSGVCSGGCGALIAGDAVM